MKTVLLHHLTRLDNYLFTQVFVSYSSRSKQVVAGLIQSALFIMVSFLERTEESVPI